MEVEGLVPPVQLVLVPPPSWLFYGVSLLVDWRAVDLLTRNQLVSSKRGPTKSPTWSVAGKLKLCEQVVFNIIFEW